MVVEAESDSASILTQGTWLAGRITLNVREIKWPDLS
jgi:hypothetical protein